MMLERGLHVDHTTIYRWVQRYAPELEKRVHAQLQPTNDSWKVDETYIKVHGDWYYLYRAVDSASNTLDFVLSPTRDARAAEYFFRKLLGDKHTVTPRVINVDKNAAYPPTFKILQEAAALAPECELRPWFRTAWATRQGYEAMNQLRKGQVAGTSKGDIVSQNRFIEWPFGLAA